MVAAFVNNKYEIDPKETRREDGNTFKGATGHLIEIDNSVGYSAGAGSFA